MVSNTQLYGAAIAFASGLYSLWSASTPTEMGTSSWLMLVLGVVVLVHGTVLLTEYAAQLGTASGPLMIGYAVIMLLNQALLANGMLDDGSGMGTGMNGGMGGSAMTTGMGWDAGMVALALLMLVSGLIMTRESGAMSDSGAM